MSACSTKYTTPLGRIVRAIFFNTLFLKGIYLKNKLKSIVTAPAIPALGPPGLPTCKSRGEGHGVQQLGSAISPMRGQNDLDPSAAAAAAARRLGSSRPLFAVSLSKAVSQLLRPTPGSESTAYCSTSSTLSSSTTSQARDAGLMADTLREEDGPLGQTVDNKPPERRTHVAKAAVSETVQTHWLTGRFIAQVRAHFEATLAALYSEKGEAADGGGEEAQSGEGEVEETIKHQRSICTAALHWGLLLILSAESALLTEGASQLSPRTPAKVSLDQQNDTSSPSELSGLELKAQNDHRHNKAESADAVLTGKIRDCLETAQLPCHCRMKKK